jgi:hypothetical protein
MAVDRPNGDRAAILLAERQGADRWLARAVTFRWVEEAWREFGDDDVPWDGDPLVRPRGRYGADAWHAAGSWGEADDGVAATCLYGAAPAEAAVLRVVAGDGPAREIWPVPETGAYVAVLGSPTWSVDVLAEDGAVLDRLAG